MLTGRGRSLKKGDRVELIAESGFYTERQRTQGFITTGSRGTVWEPEKRMYSHSSVSKWPRVMFDNGIGPSHVPTPYLRLLSDVEVLAEEAERG